MENLQEFTKEIVHLNRIHGITAEQIMSKEWIAGFADNVKTDVEGKYSINQLEAAILLELNPSQALDSYLFDERLHDETDTSPLNREEFSKAITGLYLYGAKDPEDADWVIPPGNYSAISKHFQSSRSTISRYIKNYFTELIELGFKIPNITRKHQIKTK
tara:strand:- start:12 stop:491 length:480 start_codon:yes stop_codon:yes gene_type:complete